MSQLPPTFNVPDLARVAKTVRAFETAGLDGIRERLTAIGNPPATLVGKIVCKGPCQEADYSDNRYWVQIVRPHNGESTDAIEWTDEHDISTECGEGGGASRSSKPRIVTVTNLGEDGEKTHLLVPGRKIAVLWSYGADGNVRYFSPAGDESTAGAEACSSSSSSQSSQSSSSASEAFSSISGSGQTYCVFLWSAEYGCDNTWGPVKYVGVDCTHVPHTIDKWYLHKRYAASGSHAETCLYYFYKLGDTCDGNEHTKNCQKPDDPDAPANQYGGQPPPDCCVSSQSHSSASGHSESSHSSGYGGGSNKSTAIVPASWSPTGYAALYVGESPDVRFDDVLVAAVSQKNCALSIDARFIEVCEPDSVVVCGHSINRSIAVGLDVHRGKVRVRFARQAKRKVSLVIRLTGIRKGFADPRYRFESRTKQQFERNERFIQSAY